MNILHVNTLDVGGGAEAIAGGLCRGLRRRGHSAKMAVGRKQSDDPQVVQLPSPKEGPGRLRWKIGRWWNGLRGREHFDFPGTARLLEAADRLDLIHAHNLHGGYFDLRQLPALSRRVPVMLTLHDAWLTSGHCAHSLGCSRWQTGCGNCPDLSIYPQLRRDGTAFNWQRKRDILRDCRLYIATPSQWLLERVQQSIVAPAMVDARVIPNGIDLNVFKPGDRNNARAALDLPREADVLLFAANGIRQNGFKDYETLRAALEILGRRPREQELLLVALGEDAPSRECGRATLKFIPPVREPHRVAEFFRAADLYVHAARADTFPTTVLESLACGTPVVATAVGGIPEQIRPLASGDGATGELVPPGDPQALADAVENLLGDGPRLRQLSANAVSDARQRFDVEQHVAAYVAWYQELAPMSRSRAA